MTNSADIVRIAAQLLLVTTACSDTNKITVTNGDVVPLVIEVQVSDNSLNWKESVTAGASRSFSIKPKGDVTFITTVFQDGNLVQRREKGYQSGGSPSQHTCITATRLEIAVKPCS